jgi:hypothetical protein
MATPNEYSLAYSQASLQDFKDCPRRFQLRYLLHLVWPALETEPALENELQMQHGANFHRLVQQLLLGIPTEQLAPRVKGESLELWWEKFLKHFSPRPEPGEPRYPEFTLSSSLNGQRLVAKYDLISIQPGPKFLIYDWKTNRKRPRRSWLESRLQTRLYPCLLARAGGCLAGQISPDQIEMVYWFANYPEEPERFVYSQAQMQADQEYLSALIEQIKSLGSQDFPLTSEEQNCLYCTYRSLCDRGVKAGNIEEVETLEIEDLEPSLNIEQIGEVKF